MKYSEIYSKSIITPTKLPGSDYVVNPYSGCQMGCVYCYAAFTQRFTGHVNDHWGEYVDIRVNSAELFSKELQKINAKIVKKTQFKKGERPVILFSSVTDPYQGMESKYMLTRKCLEIIAQSEINENLEVSVLTKSPLVTRDIDVFKRIRHLEVGMTITSTDDKISRLFESHAPLCKTRIQALEKLNANSIKTYAFAGPLLPHFVANEEILYDLFRSIKDSGTNFIWVEHLNLSGQKMERLMKLIGQELSTTEKKIFVESQTPEYKSSLNILINKIVSELDLELVGGEVIDHSKL